MKQFPVKQDIEGVEVRREVIMGIQAVLDSNIIKHKGISTKDFDLDLEEDKSWYPLKNLIDLFDHLATHGGPSVLQRVGEEVTKQVPRPESIKNARLALENANKSYHMNHRRDGKELYDYENECIIEGGIGHVRLVIDRENETADYVCGSFYPSDFDLGMAKQILKIFGNNFLAALSVKRDESKPSRLKGGDTCTFNLNYRLMKL